MARKRSTRGRERVIDNVRWTLGTFSIAGLGATNSALTILSDGGIEETVLRIRGELVAWKDGTSAPGVGVRVAVGILPVMGGQGTTVVSSPLADADAPWMFYESFHLAYEEMVTDVIDVPGISSFRKTIDVKSMRILRPDEELQLVVEQATVIGAMNINIQGTLRFLLGD